MSPVFEVGKPLPKHPHFDKQARARSFWRRSYRAHHDYAFGKDAGGNPILPQHGRETPESFEKRRSLAMTRRYAKSIIDRFNDHVTRQKVTRTPAADGTPYSDLINDATGNGVGLQALLKRVLRWAQIEQSCFLLADQSVQGSFASAAQDSAVGKRGILRLVRADQVCWWSDWQGQVDSALILFTDRDGTPFGWYVDANNVQRIDCEKVDEREIKIVRINTPIPHNYGGCPLVRCAPENEDTDSSDDECALDSHCAPIAESQKRILNIDSWLLEELQGATFTMPVILGCSDDQVKNVTVGPGKALAIPGNGGSTPALGKISADPAQAASLRMSIDMEVREAYRAAGLAPGNPTEPGQPESGVAKAFAFNEVEAKLAALADAGEGCENLAVERLAAGTGWPYPGDSVWPESFSTPDLADELEFTIRTLTSPLPDVLKQAQTRKYADSAYQLDPEQQALLNTQLEAITPPANPFGAGADGVGSPGLAGPPGSPTEGATKIIPIPASENPARKTPVTEQA